MTTNGNISCACGNTKTTAQQGPQGPPSISSPINFDEKAKIAPDDMKEPWHFQGLETMLCTEIRNDGEHIHIKICPKQSPVISGGGLTHLEYIIDSIDFHWCSAHTVNNKSYPLEVHILMYCSEFSGIEEAISKRGAAALSTFYEFSDKSSSGIKKILPFIPQISQNIEKAIPYCVINLQDFLPENKNHFWRYNGSVMHPPYPTGLEWTVFAQTLPITRLDLGSFTNIYDGKNKLIVANHRELQPVPENADIFMVALSNGGKQPCNCTPKN